MMVVIAKAAVAEAAEVDPKHVKIVKMTLQPMAQNAVILHGKNLE